MREHSTTLTARANTQVTLTAPSSACAPSSSSLSSLLSLLLFCSFSIFFCLLLNVCLISFASSAPSSVLSLYILFPPVLLLLLLHLLLVSPCTRRRSRKIQPPIVIKRNSNQIHCKFYKIPYICTVNPWQRLFALRWHARLAPVSGHPRRHVLYCILTMQYAYIYAVFSNPRWSTLSTYCVPPIGGCGVSWAMSPVRHLLTIL